MAKVDELNVEIKGNASDLIRTFDNIQDRVKDVVYGLEHQFANAGKAIDKVTTGFAKFGLAVEGAKAALAPFEKVIDRLNAAAGLKQTADRLGVNIERFQELSFVAEKVGATSENLADAMKDLNERIGDAARDGGNYEDQLNKIGLSSQELLNLRADEQFLKVAAAIGQLNTVGEQNFVTAELMSDAGFQMIEMFRQTPEAIQATIKEARELGAVLREDDIEAMKEAQVELNTMMKGFTALGDQLILLASGPLKEFSEVAIETLKNINKELQDTSSPLEQVETQIAAIKQEIIDTQAAVEPEGIIDKFFSSPQKREKAKEDLDELKKKLEELEAKAKEIRMQESQAAFTEIFGPPASETAAEEAPFVPRDTDTGQQHGPFIYPEEMLEENMERYQEHLQAQVDAYAQAQESIRNLMLHSINEEMMAEQKAAEHKKKMEKIKYDAARTALQSLSSLMNTESRKMFEVGKAAAIADTIMNTYRSVTKAMAEVPYPLNFGVAAAALASGLNNVNNIRNTQFGSAGAGAASTGFAPGAGFGGESQEVTQTTNVDVTLQGETFSGDQIRGLIGEINNATDDGMKLNVVTGQS